MQLYTQQCYSTVTVESTVFSTKIWSKMPSFNV